MANQAPSRRPSGRPVVRPGRWPSTPRPWGSTRIATGSAWCSSRPATATPIWCRLPRGPAKAPRLTALLADPKVLKLFHFGRFDIAVLEHALGVRCEPVYCTKIAAKLTRTFTDKFGLKDLCSELLGVDLSKQQQTSDWGADNAERRAARLCRVGRAAFACAEGQARRPAGARGPYRTRPSSLQLPAQPRPPRLGRLAGNRYLAH